MPRIGQFALAVLVALGAPAPAPAQTGPEPGAPLSGAPLSGAPVSGAPVSAPLSPVLVIRQDRLFETSAFGRAARAALDSRSKALIAENSRIEAELEAEERALTDRRATLPPEEFRPLAEAFNAKVERIRAEQDAKSRELARQSEADRKAFFDLALPVLAELMREKGAAVVLDQQAVFLSLDTIDITDEAVARIDARATVAPQPAP